MTKETAPARTPGSAALLDQAGLNVDDPKHAPVPLPPGSYDLDDLVKGLNGAARASAENRDAKIAEAFDAAAAKSNLPGDFDPALQVGDRIVEVKNETLGVTENIRVYDPKSDEAVAAADSAGTKE